MINLNNERIILKNKLQLRKLVKVCILQVEITDASKLYLFNTNRVKNIIKKLLNIKKKKKKHNFQLNINYNSLASLSSSKRKASETLTLQKFP